MDEAEADTEKGAGRLIPAPFFIPVQLYSKVNALLQNHPFAGSQ